MAQQTTARIAAGQAAADTAGAAGVAGGAGKEARDAAARKVNGMSGVGNGSGSGTGIGGKGMSTVSTVGAGIGSGTAPAARSAKLRSVARNDQASRARGGSRSGGEHPGAAESPRTPRESSRTKTSAAAAAGSASGAEQTPASAAALVKGAVAPIPVRSSSARTAARIPPVGELKLGWQERASCQQAEAAAFFAPDSERIREREKREANAKRVCEQCPVRTACLEHALAVPEQFGIWGGMTELERQEEARRRRGAGARPVVLPIRLGASRDRQHAGAAGTESDVAA